MPITPYLQAGHQFDAETKRVMGVAFEAALVALRLSDRADPVVGMVARRIIDLAKAGESNADRLCEQALTSLGFQPRPPLPPAGEPFRLRPIGR
jgi:hypothetical protein